MTDTFLNFKNGIWEVSRRRELLTHLAPRIFDETLEKLRASAITVFCELDPSLDIEPEQRFAAGIYGKAPKFSTQIKKGLSEAFAFMASHSENFENCTHGLVESVVRTTVRKVFRDSDWRRWATLNDYLPLFAEAAPLEIMTAIENEFKEKDGEAFKDLFAQEGVGITGRNYLTGILWALEIVAWNEQFLVQSAMCLAELANIDPGGNWANRPINSLTSIFLPWYPQTIAPPSKRIVAVETITSEFPDVGWNLMQSLLPNQTQMSSGSQKPKWQRWIPEKWEDGKVNRKEYWEQIDKYSKLLIKSAESDGPKVVQLIHTVPHLSEEALDAFLEYLQSEQLKSLPGENLVEIWESILSLVNHHQRSADADWAMAPALVERLASIASELSPADPFMHHRRLFQKDEFELYEDDQDWQTQGKLVQEKRLAAVKEIFEIRGLDDVLLFNEQVESHWHVGYYLSKSVSAHVDTTLLPGRLDDNSPANLQFLQGYVSGRFEDRSWDWVEVLEITNWDLERKALFLRLLPFQHTWSRVEEILGEENESRYWHTVNFNPYQKIEGFENVVHKLLQHKRPKTAAFVLRTKVNDNEKVDENLIITSLMNILEQDEKIVRNDTFVFIKLIQYLQESPDTDPDQLMKVEWAYLGILGKYNRAEPKLLRKRLATSPDFFCEIIRFMYRSRTKPETKDEGATEDKKLIAENSFRLLTDWDRVPGVQDDGSFKPDEFNSWLASVNGQCTESGHIEVAHSHIGKVLVHSPPDPDGLFIHRTIAEALNRRDADTLRNGYEIAIHNSRGVHWVDPSGNAELELAAKYEKQADDIENVGFFRLAQTLRNLAESHKKEAKRVVEEHARELAEDND